jgi:hypothetical protein
MICRQGCRFGPACRSGSDLAAEPRAQEDRASRNYKGQVSSSIRRESRLATRAYVQRLTAVPTSVTTTTRNIAEPLMLVTASPAGTATAKPATREIAHALQSYCLRAPVVDVTRGIVA